MPHNNFCWGLKKRDWERSLGEERILQIRISVACGKFLQSEPSLCVSLLSPLLPVLWRRWDEALDDETKKECSHWGWFCQSQRDAAKEFPRVWTSCTELESNLSSLCPDFSFSAALQSHWIQQGDGLVSAYPFSEQLCHGEPQLLLAMASPLCRNVLQAWCSPNLSQIMWCYLSDSHIQESLAPSNTCMVLGSLNRDTSPVETAQKSRTLTNPDNNEAAEVA